MWRLCLVVTVAIVCGTTMAQAQAQIFACNADQRRGYTAAPVTLEPVQGREKEQCVQVPRQVIVTKWACEFAKDRQAEFCHGFQNGACPSIGWVWPVNPRQYSAGNFNVYCLTGHQDSRDEWRYFRIWVYNEQIRKAYAKPRPLGKWARKYAQER